MLDYNVDMRTVSLSEAKDKLSAFVDDAERTQEIYRITRHGHASAVIVSADYLDSLHETLELLSQPEVIADLRESEADFAAGRVVSGDHLRAEYGLPHREA